MNKHRYVTALALCAIFSALLIGCGGGARNLSTESAAPQASASRTRSFAELSEDGFSYDVAYLEGLNVEVDEGARAHGQQSMQQRQRIILEAELRMATDRFDEVTARIRSIANETGGFVQDSEQHMRGGGLRWFMITIRVPYEQYELAMSQIKDLCVLYSVHESQRNVTAEYYDINARLQTKLIEEERLLVLIDRTESIEDILELESLLGRVRTQIEVYQTQMTSIDRLASYSTINVYLDEVRDETTVIIPTNLSGRVYESFIQSVNSTIRFAQVVLIFLVGISMPLFVALVAAAIIWGLFRIRRAAQKKRKEKNK